MNNKVTLVCVTYNQEKFVLDAIKSVLNQDLKDLNIIISDDCSTDGTAAIVECVVSTYNGPHKVTFIKNQENKGLIRNLWGAFELIDSGLVILAAGDDISLTNRASCLYQNWIKLNYPKILSSGHYTINQFGDIINENAFFNDIHKIESKFNIGYEFTCRGATVAFDIDLVKYFPIPKYKNCVEDIIMTYRASMIGNAYCIPELLVKYRVSDNTLSNVNNDSWQDYISSILKLLYSRLDSAKALMDDLFYHPDINDGNHISLNILKSISKLEIEIGLFNLCIFSTFIKSIKTKHTRFYFKSLIKLTKDLAWIQKNRLFR